MMENSVLVIDKMHDSLSNLLKGIGYEMVYRPDIRREEILRIIGDYSGLIVRSKTRIDEELISKGLKLKWVGRAGAGMDNLDLVFLEKRGIKVVNAPEGNRDALGEHGVGMILSLLHRLNTANNQIKGGIWDREGNRGFELKGRTVGIFGYGHMGNALARKLRGFECRVIGYDKYKTGFADENIEEVHLDTFRNETEILSIHVPLTHETNRLFTYEYLDQFKRLFLLLNTARGEVLVLKDLLRLLTEFKIAGAALDVLENEKINKLLPEEKKVFDELRDRNNVIFTPHVAGWTFESYEKINEVLVDKISRLKL
jgi:D-3-phosphoglycerate dehydrogenase